jgi:cystathionine beta-lyase
MNMKYDFTSIIDRKGYDAIAVDLPENYLGNYAAVKREEGFDVIPMWVADMNFPVVPTIQKAVIDRVNHPAFGYFSLRDEYFELIRKWQETRNHVSGLENRHIGYENGVLGGVVSAMNVLASKGDNVLVHSPTYIGFTMSLENNGYNIVHSPLYQDENNVWRMDYEDMEKKIVDHKIHVAIMCNPHNPSGRVWTKEELEKAMAIYEKHNVWVISDEIWSDLLLNGNSHIPTQSVNEYAHNHTAAFYAPSKTFNLAGLIGSYHIIYNDWLRERIEKESSLSHYNSMNVLSMYALIGAYQPEGYEWVDELKEVLSENVAYACDYIEQNFKGVTLSRPQGTYMLFIDCEGYCKAHGIDMDTLLHKGWKYGVYWQDGRPFHGQYSIRMNLALPLSRVREAFDRLDQHVFND